MKFKCYYDKTLKMSEGKIAAQVGHVMKMLGRQTNSVHETDVIIVLGLSHKKFMETLQALQISDKLFFAQEDNGITEVEAGTITAFGFVND